jgi:hypothetical protein
MHVSGLMSLLSLLSLPLGFGTSLTQHSVTLWLLIYLRKMWPFGYLFRGSKSFCSLDRIVDTSRSFFFGLYSISINLFYFFPIPFSFSIHWYSITFLILVCCFYTLNSIDFNYYYLGKNHTESVWITLTIFSLV